MTARNVIDAALDHVREEAWREGYREGHSAGSRAIGIFGPMVCVCGDEDGPWKETAAGPMCEQCLTTQTTSSRRARLLRMRRH